MIVNDDDAVVSFPEKPRCPSPGEVERRLDELEDCLVQTQNATIQVMRSASDAHVALVDACRRQQTMIEEIARRLVFLEHAVAVANGDAPWWRRLLAAAGSPPRKPR